ncbi:MAG: bifunctional oligoribonuclease/PAP phosphatase NrnA, partial [Faecalibacillus sp.]
MLRQILNKIAEYEDIVIYRHINPDYDALGSQYGLYYLIKDNFEGKNVYLEGIFSTDLIDKYDYDGDYHKPDFIHPTLGIVLDTASKERIDGESYQKCQEI